MRHTLLPLSQAIHADALDLGLWIRLTLQRSARLVSGLFCVLLVGAALAIQSPDGAQTALTNIRGPGGSGTSHGAISVLRQFSFRNLLLFIATLGVTECPLTPWANDSRVAPVFHVIIFVEVLDDEVQVGFRNVFKALKILSKADTTDFPEDFVMA